MDSNPTPLSDEDVARLKGTMEEIRATFPEFIPIAKDLIALGMISGLRDVEFEVPPSESSNEDGQAVSAAEMNLILDEGLGSDDLPYENTRYK